MHESPFVLSPPSTSTPETRRAWWASSVGRYACKRREELGMTLARAAELSGPELSEWCALESGWIPEDMNTIRAIAGTLRIDWKDLSFLACFAGSFQDCC
jgi:transcriptional regulator with XRE-family HTH domain